MKTIIITGASRGIGLATAKKFLAEGWKVIGTYLNTPTPVEHPNLISIKYEQGDSQSIASAVEEIKKIAPIIDTLVNNAGVVLDLHETTADIEKIRKTFDVNLFGLIDFTEKLLPFISRDGHIINVDSNYGAFSTPIDDETSSAYRISKAALNMYTRTLAFRTKDAEIIVSSLDPGWVKTDMGNAGATEEYGSPDREPEQPAEEIYNLVTNVKESGYFWKFGKKREW